MLNQATKDKLKALGFDVDKLVAAAVHAEEQDFTVPDIRNYSDDDLNTRDTNTKAEAIKEGKKEGKKAGIEIATKAIADKFGLKDIPLNEPDKIAEALDKHFKGGDDSLKEQVRLLQAEIGTVKAEKDTAIAKVQEASFDRDLLSMFPQNRQTTLTDTEYLTLLKGQLSFETNEGVTLVKKGGEVLRDATTKNPVPVKDAVASIFNERKWVGEANNGGRGGNDNQNSSGGIKSLSKFMEKWESDGKNTMSVEFEQALQAQIKSTTDFDLNA